MKGRRSRISMYRRIRDALVVKHSDNNIIASCNAIRAFADDKGVLLEQSGKTTGNGMSVQTAKGRTRKRESRTKKSVH